MARGPAVCGMFAPVVFTAAWIAAGFVQQDYDPAREDISGLAALTAEHAWIMVGGLIVSGLLTLAFAVGLARSLGAGVVSTLGSALLGTAGAGLVALGLLRNDCSSLTAACEARVDAGDVSWHHTAHDLLSAPVFAAAVLAPLAMALRFRADSRWRPLARLSGATAPVLAVLFVLGGIEAIPSWNGGLQRAAATTAFAWMEAAAVQLLRIETGPRRGNRAREVPRDSAAAPETRGRGAPQRRR